MKSLPNSLPLEHHGTAPARISLSLWERVAFAQQTTGEVSCTGRNNHPHPVGREQPRPSALSQRERGNSVTSFLAPQTAFLRTDPRTAPWLAAVPTAPA